MRYDIDDIALRVEALKRKFKITGMSCFFIILLSVLIAVYFPDTTVVFICTASIVLAAVYFIRFIKRNNPMIIFSKGFRGENIKEHEYVTGGSRLYRYGGLRYTYNPQRHRGDVYIRLENGDVTVVSYLPKKHLDIFEIGDTLVCFPGTRYPNVDSRDVKEQPCPLCGYVNGKDDEYCEKCGLKILKCK